MSPERRLDKKLLLKNSYDQTITCDLDKGYIVKIDKMDCFNVDCPHEWYLPHHPIFLLHKAGKFRRVLNGAAKFHGSTLNKALLT